MALTIGKQSRRRRMFHVEALAPFNSVHTTALVGPVLSDLSKLCRLWAIRRITNDSEVLDLRVVVRQHRSPHQPIACSRRIWL